MKPISRIFAVLFVLISSHALSQQVYEADNGITASGSGTTRKVSLGGTLTANTAIPLAGFSLNLTGDGYFGIGTNSPATRFHLYKNINSDFSPLMRLEDGFADGFTMMQFRATNHIYNIGAGNGNWFDLQNDFFIWDETNTTARMVVSSTGNVGIGVNDPTNRLSIAAASAGSSGLQFTQLNNSSTAVAGNGKVLGLDASGNVILVNDAGAGNSWALTGNSGTIPGTDFLGTTDNLRLVFKTNNTERATILETGNFGLNTATPATLLDVNGTSTFRNSLTANFGVTNRTAQLRDDGLYISRVSDGSYVSSITGDGTISFNTRNDYRFFNFGTETMTILLNGNVGIGVINPTAKLQVSKAFIADGKIAEFGGASVNSNLSYVYGSTADIAYLNIGSTFSLRRNGGGSPSLNTPNPGMSLVSHEHINIATDAGSPGEIRFIGNFSLGDARIGGYNPGASGKLVIGNSYNDFSNLHHTWFRNGSIRVTNASNQVQAILNEAGQLGLGISTPAAQLHTTGTIRFAGLTNNDALTQVLATDASGNVFWRDAATLGGAANAWVYGGNNVGSTSMIGNTSAQNLQIITDNTARITIHATNGNVGIGTESIGDAAYKLYVEGNIRTRKVRVDQLAWADFVFYPGYNLRPLTEVERFIATHKHLPDVPSAAEVEKEGIDLGDNQAVLLRKIEELTLYIIEQNKRMEEQEKRIQQMEQQVQNK